MGNFCDCNGFWTLCDRNCVGQSKVREKIVTGLPLHMAHRSKLAETFTALRKLLAQARNPDAKSGKTGARIAIDRGFRA